jgi:hypothetical protein
LDSKTGSNSEYAGAIIPFPKALQVLELYPGALGGIQEVFSESSDFDVSNLHPDELSAFDQSFPVLGKFTIVSQQLFQEIIKLKHHNPDPIDMAARSKNRNRLT